MSISYGLNLGIMNGAADGDLYGNAMRAFQRACDAFLQPIVKGYLTNTPPGSPVDGDMYIVGSSPTGSWASYAGYVAKWSALLAAWEFYLPKNGWQFQSNSARESYRYTGSTWGIYYQEGTWTPSIQGTTTAGSHAYSVQAGTFRRIGGFVQVWGRTKVASYDPAMAGSATMAGLPYPSANVVYHGSSIMAASLAGVTNNLTGGVSSGSSVISLFKNLPNATLTSVAAADIQNNTDLIISTSYDV